MFFGKKIKQLTAKDLADTIELYADTCRYDKDFCNMFMSPDCYSFIKQEFSPDVEAALSNGVCLGVYSGRTLIGCLLSIDWYKYMEEYPAQFAHMFPPELDSTKRVIEYMSQHKSVFFVFAIGIQDGQRCQGNASALIKQFTSMVKKGNAIVTDCIYEYASSMWLKHGYRRVNEGKLQLMLYEVE